MSETIMKLMDKMLEELDIDLNNLMESVVINLRLITIELINQLHPTVKSFMFNWFREYFNAHQKEKIDQIKYLSKDDLKELEDILYYKDGYAYNMFRIWREIYYF